MHTSASTPVAQHPNHACHALVWAPVFTKIGNEKIVTLLKLIWLLNSIYCIFKKNFSQSYMIEGTIKLLTLVFLFCHFGHYTIVRVKDSLAVLRTIRYSTAFCFQFCKKKQIYKCALLWKAIPLFSKHNLRSLPNKHLKQGSCYCQFKRLYWLWFKNIILHVQLLSCRCQGSWFKKKSVYDCYHRSVVHSCGVKCRK